MKTIISYALALGILLSVPGMALAKEKEKKPLKEKPFIGQVTAVDAKANTIQVTKADTGEEKTFQAADATITVAGDSAKLADITIGMHAKVTVLGTQPGTAAKIEATKGGS